MSVDENMNEKMEENLYKRNKVKTIYVGFSQNKSTNEMFKLQFKAILHISLI